MQQQTAKLQTVSSLQRQRSKLIFLRDQAKTEKSFRALEGKIIKINQAIAEKKNEDWLGQ